MPILILVSALLLASVPLAAGFAAAEATATSSAMHINTIRSLLYNGNPEIAKKKAYDVLKANHMNDRERRNLLRIIAIAEEMQSALHAYSDADTAIAAWRKLLKEFVSPDDAAGIRWKISWLHWKKGNLDAARRAAKEVLKESPGTKQAKEARLLLARMDIQRGKLHSARKNLMKYMLDATSDIDQARGLAWMSVVDFRGHRNQVAFDNVGKAIELAPGLVSSNVTLLSTYIQLLFERQDEAALLRQTELFFDRYLDHPEAMLIRLMRADLMAVKGKLEEAEKSYERLSEVAPETSIGIKAFMRKMMLQQANNSDLETLKPVLASLSKLAIDNQISNIEDEAMLDQAILWTRLAGQIDRAEEKALALYTQVSVGTVPTFAVSAKQQGYSLFVRHINATLEQQAWLESIVLWRRYAQLRESPEALKGTALKEHRRMLLGVAKAMRSLMDFQAAEELLAALHADTRSSVQGDRVMLERAKLWLDRRDEDGYAKIMRWLEAHNFTLYRPEMLLVAARIQLRSHQPSQASQTLRQVVEQDLAPAMRPDYWHSKAEIAETLDQWHLAATTWAKHATLLDKVPTGIVLRHADALFMAAEYAEANQVYLQIPEHDRNPRWQYRLAVCEVRTGQRTQAQERLTALMQNPDAAEYALRARLLLADREAISLMEKF